MFYSVQCLAPNIETCHLSRLNNVDFLMYGHMHRFIDLWIRRNAQNIVLRFEESLPNAKYLTHIVKIPTDAFLLLIIGYLPGRLSK